MPISDQVVQDLAGLSNAEWQRLLLRVRAERKPPATNEGQLVAEWLAASRKSLFEVWDNDEDAVYDHL